MKAKNFLLLVILLFSCIGEILSQSCSCSEYIYLNEIANGGRVHKYRVNADGSITEINPNGPWYPNGGSSQLPRPHGLGTDLNGYLYIASTFDPSTGQIRRLTCDGEITPTNEFVINNAGTFNITSVGNTIFANTSGQTNVTAFSACTGAVINSVCFNNPPCAQWEAPCNGADWGFYYDKRTGYFYTAFPQDQNDNGGNANRRAAIYRYTINDFGSGTCVDPLVESTSTVFRQLPTVGAHEIPLTNISGITTDDQGNIYYVATGYLEDGQIIKLDSDGNFLAASAIDNQDGNGGYWGARAIVWSETNGRLYVSTQTTTITEDCIAIFDTDLNYLGAAAFAGGTTGTSGSGKAMAIGIECCPLFTNAQIDTTLCSPAVGTNLNLIEFLPCEFICAGEWTVVSNTAGTYNSCDNTFTYNQNGSACFTYDYVPLASNQNAICQEFHIEVCISFENPPTATVTSAQGTCTGSTPNNNATINITSAVNADVANFSTGATYTGPAYGGAGQVNISSGSGMITGLMHNTQYTVRVFNGSNECYVDYIVTTPSIACCALTVQCTPQPQTNCSPVNGSASVVASNAVGTVTYLWSSGETTSTISNKAAGTYTVTVTDGGVAGCSRTCEAIIANNANAPTCTITVNTQPSCANLTGGSITVNPNPAGTYNYAWSDSGPATASRTGLTGGTYTVTVTNTTTGCTGVCQTTLDTPMNCCNINAITVQSTECLDNGTPNLMTDNRLRVGILATNSNSSLTTYNVSVTGTTITPSSGSYGVGTFFTLGSGTGGSGATYTITLTDSMTPGCTASVQVVAPENCQPATQCPTPRCGTANIQVNGN